MKHNSLGSDEFTKHIDKATNEKLSTDGGYTLTQILTMEFPPIKWFVRENENKLWFTSGLNLFAARPKIGKSFFVMNLGLSLISGKDLMSAFEVKEGTKMLYIDFEGGASSFKGRMVTMTKSYDESLITDNFFWQDGQKLLDRAFNYDYILDYLKSKINEGYDFIVIDTIEYMLPSINTGNAYNTDVKKYSPLRKLAIENDICIVGVHHTNKGKEFTDPFDMISGSNGIAGSATNTMIMYDKVSGNDNYIIFKGRGKEIRGFEHALKFDENTFHFEYAGEALTTTETHNKAMIIEAMKHYKGVNVTNKGIEEYLMSKNAPDNLIINVSNYLRRLESEGIVSKEKRGVWNLKDMSIF